MRLLFTTNPGIEDIVVDEAKAKLRAKPVEVNMGRGRVIVDIPSENFLDLVVELRSVHRARILLVRSKICPQKECLKELKELIEASGVTEYITPTTSFAVRAERSGVHDYTSLDIARVAGDAVIEAVRSKYGKRPPVDLDYPSVIVAVDVILDDVYVAIEMGGDLSWHRRGYRVYEHPAALKPTLAFAMVMLSGVRDGESLLDPMCGGGTIPIEAAYLLESSKLHCSDFNPRHIQGAKLNAKAAMVLNRIVFKVLDARRLDRVYSEIDYIVSNPPYGIRLGNPKAVREVYLEFLKAARNVLVKRMVLITTEHEFVKSHLEELGYRLVHERRVAHGDLWPKILVIE